MKQIAQDVKKGVVKVWDVPEPTCGAGEILVRVGASLISAGTERMVMDFAGKSMIGKAKARPDLVKKVLTKLSRDGLADTVGSVMSRLSEPLPLGYSAAGVVEKVGAKLLNEFKVGDRVAVAGAGLANHAEVCAIPRNLAVKLPAAVGVEEGCYATLGAIALQGVRQAHVVIGDRVLVVGLGLVGQLAAQLARAAGARVAVLDYNAQRVDLAKKLGAELGVVGADGTAAFEDFTGGRGFDSILLCAATDTDGPLNDAAAWARDRATVVLVGKVGTRFDYANFMKKEINVKVSRSYGPGRYDPAYEQGGLGYPVGYVPHTERDHLAQVCHLMGTGQLNVAALTTHTFDFKNALEAYDLIGEKTPYLGVVLDYGVGGGNLEKGPLKDKGNLDKNAAKVLRWRCGEGTLAVRDVPNVALEPCEGISVGVIGTGSYVRGVLLPRLCKIAGRGEGGHGAGGVTLGMVASKGGLSAAHTAKTFAAHGAVAGGSAADVLASGCDAVVIGTRHNTHAALVGQALAAGKHVWVEKPLAMSFEELDEVGRAWEASGSGNLKGAKGKPKASGRRVLMVGFNRRYAPALVALKAAFDRVGGARQVSIRVNAGKLEGGWQMTDEGGGRLLGEACHFTDLALWLAGSPVTRVQAVRGGGQDVYVLTLTHADGGVSVVTYGSEGDASAPKERVEVMGGGAFGVMDNYARATFTHGGRTRVLLKKPFWAAQDKGQAGALAAWVAACEGRGIEGERDRGALPSVAELLASSAVILACVRSLETGMPVDL